MLRFDVVKNLATTAKHSPLLLVLQSELLDDMPSCVVAPLIKAQLIESKPMQILNPTVDIDGQTYVIQMQLLAGINRRQMGKRVANIESHRTEIIRAIDFLFSGF